MFNLLHLVEEKSVPTDIPLIVKTPKEPSSNASTAVISSITSGVPIPERSQPRRYPWTDMQKDDSFHVSSTDDLTAEFNRVRTSAAAASKKYGRKFIARRARLDDPEGPGVRVWRIS